LFQNVIFMLPYSDRSRFNVAVSVGNNHGFGIIHPLVLPAGIVGDITKAVRNAGTKRNDVGEAVQFKDEHIVRMGFFREYFLTPVKIGAKDWRKAVKLHGFP